MTAAGLVALAAGGTGGHLFPAQALARALLARGHEVALLTDSRGQGFGADLAQVPTHRLGGAAVVGTSPLRKAAALLGLLRGALQARRLLRRLRARTVVGFGGYASLPAVWAGASLGLDVVLHEQNARMGRANRLVAGRARAVATSFAEVDRVPEKARPRLVLTGNPVRPAIAALGGVPYPAEAERLGLLVFGGSQGARAFDALVPAAVALLPAPLRARLSVAQQVRGEAPEGVAARYAATGVAAEIKPFFDDMSQRFAAASLVLCRAGASTIAELAAAGRPALLVPYPFAADDHQTANAEAFAAAGAGWVVPQSALSAETLAERLKTLLGDPAMLARAAAAARAFALPDAAERLATLVEEAAA